MRLALISIIVADYDEAIAFFTGKLGFELIEDRPDRSNRTGRKKRWVVVAPQNGGCQLLLAEAADEKERAAIGNQTADRVGFFLHTDDFEESYQRLRSKGVEFKEEPRHEPYGTVAVFVDVCGNPWDLMQPAR